ncbi:phosphatase PAP2 family protein [Sphingomonas jaspsi]|uniref:phosphatase PAP2 family protein n=1 Tax=Sphingomonas jaspsi TaxID=392409 RepID=UPI00055B4538|nr:phosphatase PAP2 family protein [Sphingomonas jaspsi]
MTQPDDEISIAKAYGLPVALTAITFLIAISLGAASGVRPYNLFGIYLWGWAAATLLCLLVAVFFEAMHLALTKADRPVSRLMESVRVRTQLAPVAAFLFPLFLGAYTWAKCSIPRIVGYRWEAFWSDADRLVLFGNDGWKIAHAILPTQAAPFLSFFYAIGWGLALVVGSSLYCVSKSRREVATFFSALMLSWLIGGVCLAYAVSAAGPIFVHLSDSALAARFEPLRAQLLSVLGDKNTIISTQRYLAAGIDKAYATKGSGVSAMPSMHIATATILLIATRRRWLLPFACLFWLTTFFGSVYFGYHYALDAPVAAGIAIACWWISARYYSSGSVRSAMIPAQATV